ncbi:MAG: methyltransferase domain-containing protein [Candidatus Rokubacteria bacterium]|nr:methyltransferase domain-containing protein [Candidatus Rokubacteria bacterium]
MSDRPSLGLPGSSAAVADNRAVWSRRDAIELRESRLRKVERLIAQDEPGDLLDVGCGAGEFSARCIALGWRVFGLELIVAQATRAAARGVVAVAGEVSGGLPFRSGVFDAVFAGEIIEHLLDTDGFLAEVHRVLRPAGAVVITTPNLASFENRVRLLCGRYPEWVDYRLGSSGHVRAYTPRVLRSQIERHGFRVERHVGNWVPFVPQRWADDVGHPWLSCTGDWWPNLAMAIVMKCRKTR